MSWNLTQSALRLMGGDDVAALYFIQCLPAALIDSVAARFTALSEAAWLRLVVDRDAFLSFKAPLTTVPLEIEHFRQMVEWLFADDMVSIKSDLASCSLDQAYVIFSSSKRILGACKRLPVVKGAPLDFSKGPLVEELLQSSLF